jgi:ribosomal protein L27
MLIIVFALSRKVCILYSIRARDTRDVNNRGRERKREATRDTLGGNFKPPARGTESFPGENVTHSG